MSLQDIFDEQQRYDEQLARERQSALEEQFYQEELLKERDEEESQFLIGGIKKGIRETIEDPVSAVPALLETAGSIGMSLTPAGPVGPVVGGMIGRAIGETIYSAIRGKPLFTAENAYEVLSGGLIDASLGLAAAGVKRAIKGATPIAEEALHQPVYPEFKLPDTVQGVVAMSLGEAHMKRTLAFNQQPLAEVKKIRDQLAKEAEPAVPEGMTRLYRAIPPKAKKGEAAASDVEPALGLTKTPKGEADIDVGPATKAPTDQGVFFSRKRELAEETMEKDEAGRAYGRLRYLDIPNSELEALEQATGLKTFENVKDRLLLPKGAAEKAVYHSLSNQSEAEKKIAKQIKVTELYRDEIEDMSSIQAREWVSMFGEQARELQGFQYVDKPQLHALEAAGRGLGLTAPIWDSAVVLNQIGLGHIATAGIKQHTLSTNLKAFANARTVKLAKKYGPLTDADKRAMEFFHYFPEYMEPVLAGSFKPVQGIPGPALKRAAALVKETGDDLNKGMYAVQLEVNPDPKKLALWNRGFVQTTSTVHQNLDDLTQRLTQTNQLLSEMAPHELEGQFGQLLKRQAGALDRSIKIAQEAAPRKARAAEVARQHFEQFGTIPGKEVGAHLQKDWDLAFGGDYFAILNDRVNAQVDRIVSDASMPGFRHMLGAITDPAKLKYASDYVMALGGSQKMVELGRMAAIFKNAPGLPQGVRDYLGDGKNMVKAYEGINQWSFVTNIGVNARHLGLNLMQHMLTTRHLVGDEALGHGIMSTTRELGKMLATGNIGREKLIQNSPLLQRAIKAGAIKPKSINAISEAGDIVTQGKLMDAATAIPFYGELTNRLVAFQAGEYAAKAAGKTGDDALAYAKEMVTRTQFDYTPATRATISKSVAGSLMFRFKSFGFKYGHFLAGLAKQGKYKELSEAVGSVLAIGGTAAVPGYDMVRWGAAQAGLYLPEIDPLYQVTGYSLGNSVSPWPAIPATVEDALGPVFGPAAQAVSGLAKGDLKQAGIGAQRLALGSTAKVVQGAMELSRGGETRTPSGKQVSTQRETKDILASMAGFAPQPGALQGKYRRNLELAYQAKDRQAIRRETQEARERGVRNLRRLQGQARGNNTRGETESFLGTFFGY